jgi:hypothetical protein
LIELVAATMEKYGTATEDVYRFDEKGFQRGFIYT